MFSGIIEAQAKAALKRRTLEVELPRGWNLKPGASLAVNGACLTVAGKKGAKAVFDLSNETRRVTNLGRLGSAAEVNLERPLKWRGRVEGHFVLGHVDGIGKVRAVKPEKTGTVVTVAYPKRIGRWLRSKGSVAVDGVSLTIGRISRGTLTLHLIPFTLEATTLSALHPGSFVNLEADYLAKLQK